MQKTRSLWNDGWMDGWTNGRSNEPRDVRTKLIELIESRLKIATNTDRDRNSERKREEEKEKAIEQGQVGQ